MTLYAWHILSLPVYMKHEEALSKGEPGFCKDFTTTDAFHLLADDPDAKLVLSCQSSPLAIGYLAPLTSS